MFSLPDAWVWDFWPADTGEDHHTDRWCGPRARTRTGGVWLAPVDDATGVIDAKASYLLTDERPYVGRLVLDRSGQWVLLAFRNVGEDGRFIGSICDPLPVDWEHGPDGKKRLVLRDDSMRPHGLRDSEGSPPPT